MTKKPISSKDKQKRGELEAAELLKEFGFDARRSQQYCGAEGDDDLKHDMEGFHLEVKRREKLSLYEAMAQAAGDAREDETPVVLFRMNDRPWLAITLARDFLALCRDYVFEDDDDD